MKKLRLLSLVAMLLMVVSCAKDEIEIQPDTNLEINQKKALSIDEINAEIKQSLETNGSFDWKDASDLLLWSATVHGNKILTVGYGSTSFNNTKSASLNTIKNDIINTIKANQNTTNTKSGNDILAI